MAVHIEFFSTSDALDHRPLELAVLCNVAQFSNPHQLGQARPDVQNSVQVTVHECAVVGGSTSFEAPDNIRLALAPNLPHHCDIS